MKARWREQGRQSFPTPNSAALVQTLPLGLKAPLQAPLEGPASSREVEGEKQRSSCLVVSPPDSPGSQGASPPQDQTTQQRGPDNCLSKSSSTRAPSTVRTASDVPRPREFIHSTRRGLTPFPLLRVKHSNLLTCQRPGATPALSSRDEGHGQS